MKELETPNKLKPEIEVSVKVKQQKEFKLIGKTRYHNGHKCFEYNKTTGEITEAEYEKADIKWNETTNLKQRSKRVVLKKDCIYRTALNKENFIKKLRKEGLAV